MKLLRTFVFSLVFVSTAGFASSKISLDFLNCTNKKITVNWDGYNFSFDQDIAKDEADHGSFTLEPGNTIKTLWTHFDVIPEGHVKVNVKGGVNGDFKIEQTMNPLGGLKYFTTSNKISFENKVNIGAKIHATNTVKLGC